MSANINDTEEHIFSRFAELSDDGDKLTRAIAAEISTLAAAEKYLKQRIGKCLLSPNHVYCFNWKGGRMIVCQQTCVKKQLPDAKAILSAIASLDSRSLKTKSAQIKASAGKYDPQTIISQAVNETLLKKCVVKKTAVVIRKACANDPIQSNVTIESFLVSSYMATVDQLQKQRLKKKDALQGMKMELKQLQMSINATLERTRSVQLQKNGQTLLFTQTETDANGRLKQQDIYEFVSSFISGTIPNSGAFGLEETARRLQKHHDLTSVPEKLGQLVISKQKKKVSFKRVAFPVDVELHFSSI